MKNLLDYTIKELENRLLEDGFKPYAARQVFEWIYQKKQFDFYKMTNIAKPLQKKLSHTFTINTLEVFSEKRASDGTIKWLFVLEDGALIETVLMRHPYGDSICVTSQVGCSIGCAFCASGLEKKTRDLRGGEMVAQVMSAAALANLKPTHVVIMGTGEPFDNYNETMRFIDIVNAPYGLAIGARHITVSTSGIVPKIDQFAKEKRQVNLAISLHAADNETRSKLMRINNVYPLESLLDSVKRYVKTTNRRVTFEYILLGGVNDSIADADRLSDCIRGINGYVNLIPYNSVGEFPFVPSSTKTAKAFHDRLMKRGINATLRREKGADIDAACGQLRTNTIQERKKGYD